MQASNLFIKFALLSFIILVCDRTIGLIFSSLHENAKGGYIQRDNYIVSSMNSDIVILGSSRALHHYIPKIITNSLNHSAYNCGKDGNGIIYEYGLMSLITERYQPKYVIIDIEPNFDLAPNDNTKYINPLKPFYNNTQIKAIINDVDPNSKLKMMSKAYQFNSRIFNLIKDSLSEEPISKDNGYIPEPEYAMRPIEDPSHPTLYPVKIDNKKIEYLERLFFSLKGKSKVWVVISPTYFNTPYAREYIDLIRSTSNKYGFEFKDYSGDREFVKNSNLFFDSVHLNDKGAQLFTKKISDSIKLENNIF